MHKAFSSTTLALSLVGSVLGSAIVIGGVACSSSSSTGSPTNIPNNSADSGTPQMNGMDSGTTRPSQDSGVVTPVGDSSTPPPTGDSGLSAADMACSQMSAEACSTCCETNHTEGDNTFENAFFNCVCTAQQCQTQCAQTDCSDSPDAGFSMMGDPCDTCENTALGGDGGGPCGIPANTACNADPDCVAENNCFAACPQQ